MNDFLSYHIYPGRVNIDDLLIKPYAGDAQRILSSGKMQLMQCSNFWTVVKNQLTEASIVTKSPNSLWAYSVPRLALGGSTLKQI